MIVRDFGTNGQFTVSDWTEELNVIPNQWGTIQKLGIFQQESVAEHVVQFEEVIQDGALVVDVVRGARSNVGRDYQRKIHSFNIPHFPMEDAIYPQDIQGKRAYGSATEAETLDAVRGRKLQRIAQNHAWTLEYARAYSIVNGTVYAPNGTVTQDWYQEFTQTTRPAAIDFTLGTSTAEPIGNTQLAIAAIQDNSGSVNMSGIVALCGATFFQKLIVHPLVKLAYQYFTSTQLPMRNNLGTIGADPGSLAMHRTFDYAGVLFIEMRDTYAGNLLIPASDAYFLPLGTDFFKTFFSPANKFGIVNTLGEPMYVFETMSPNGSAYVLETEANMINCLLKPLLVVKATTSN